MHPIELLKTPFGPVCLVTPFEYSELEDPSPKHVQGYTGARLILSFQVHPDKELLGYNVEPYLSGVFNLFKQQFHVFGIFGIVTTQSLVLPCSYRDLVLGQFFMEQILKVCNFIPLWKRLNGGTVPPFKMHPGGTVPPFNMHPGGTVPPYKMYPGGTVPPFKMHPGGTLRFYDI